MQQFSYHMTEEEIQIEMLYDMTDEIDEQILQLQKDKMDVMEKVFVLRDYMEHKGRMYV